MLEFLAHPHFDKEAAAVQRRFPAFNKGFESFKKICEVHFDPVLPKQVLAPGKLHRIKGLDNYTIWKIELAIKGLRPNQFPRMWFAIRGSVVVFLCVKTHVDNYDDNTCNTLAENLITDIF